jgi:hypothetical protein
MEDVAFDVEGCHFGVADSDALFIGVGVEFAADRQARLGRGRCDQFDDCRPAREPAILEVGTFSTFTGCLRLL